MSYKKGKYINILSKMKDEDFLCFARKFNCNTIGLKMIRYNTSIWIEEDCGNWEYIFTDFSCEAKRVLPNQNLPTTLYREYMTKAFPNYRADFKKFSKLNKTDLKNAEDANEMVV